MNTKLLGSAPTLETLQKGIEKFYGGTVISLIQLTPKEWKVNNGLRDLEGVRVIWRGSRFRFEMIIKGNE